MYVDVLPTWMNLFCLHKLLYCFSQIVTEALLTAKMFILVCRT